MAFNLFDFIQSLVGILHTFVKFLPLGIYSFAYLSSALFKDGRTGLLLLGLIFNDIIGYIFKRYFKYEANENCAIFSSKTEGTSLGFLPNAHSEIVSFLSAFFFSDMWNDSKIDPIPFSFLIVLLVLTAWSRLTIGCKTVKDLMFNIIMGGLLGMLYYYMVKGKYQKAKEAVTKSAPCENGFGNYTCNEITDGVVMVKGKEAKTSNNTSTTGNTSNTINKNEYQGWYDTS